MTYHFITDGMVVCKNVVENTQGKKYNALDIAFGNGGVDGVARHFVSDEVFQSVEAFKKYTFYMSANDSPTVTNGRVWGVIRINGIVPFEEGKTK